MIATSNSGRENLDRAQLEALGQAARAAANELLDNLAARDLAAVAAACVPGGPAAIIFEVFGVLPLGWFFGFHLPSHEIAYNRMRISPAKVELEACRDLGEEEGGKIFYTYEMRLYRGTWRLWSVLPLKLEQTFEDTFFVDPILYEYLDGTRICPVEPGGPHDEVEELLATELPASNFGLWWQATAIRIWRDFVRAAKPTIKRPEEWAAAVEYIMVLLEHRDGTQKTVAANYGVSVNALATRYKEIVARLKIVEQDERYTQWSESHRRLIESSLALGVPKRQLQFPLGAGRGKSYFF